MVSFRQLGELAAAQAAQPRHRALAASLRGAPFEENRPWTGVSRTLVARHLRSDEGATLNDTGSAWIGFGGSLRGRLAYQSTVTYGGPFDFEPTMWTERFRGYTDIPSQFRVFGEYSSYSSIEALVDTFGAPASRLDLTRRS